MRTLALLSLLIASSAFAATDADREKAFKADIAPLLEKSCANCHDPKKAKNGKVKSGFNSSSLAEVIKGGSDDGAGITWGDASKSSIFKSVSLALTDPEHDDAMPLKKSYEKNPPLTKEQVAKVKAFIEAK
jgi:Planctomycete cytochrome C